MKQKNDLALHMHDLKNMLTVLQGNLELFCFNHIPMREKEAIARNLCEVIPSIYSQMELFLYTGKKKAETRGIVQFSDLLKEIVTFWQKLGKYKNAAWKVEIEPGVTVQGPSCAVKTLGHNILSNALKHGDPAKEITVSVAKKGQKVVWKTSNSIPDTFEKTDRGGEIHFGREMLEILIRKMNGKVEISEKEHRYTVSLELPILEKF